MYPHFGKIDNSVVIRITIGAVETHPAETIFISVDSAVIRYCKSSVRIHRLVPTPGETKYIVLRSSGGTQSDTDTECE